MSAAVEAAMREAHRLVLAAWAERDRAGDRRAAVAQEAALDARYGVGGWCRGTGMAWPGGGGLEAVGEGVG